MNKRCGALAAEDEFNDIWEEMQEVARSLYETPAQTMKGVRIKVEALKPLAWADEITDDDWWQSISRDIAAIADQPAVRLSDVEPSANLQKVSQRPASSDPIYALLKRHDAEFIDYKATDAAHGLHDRIQFTPEGKSKKGAAALRRAERAMNHAWEQWAATAKEIVDCVPATRHGLQCKFDHLARVAKQRGGLDDVINAEAFEGLVKATLQSI